MRSNSIREAVLGKYAVSTPKMRIDTLYKSRASKTKGTTLEEFYREVYTKNSTQFEQVYSNKNANEIESMMMQNRKLIEAQRNFKK